MTEFHPTAPSPSGRSRIRRLPARGRYDRATIDSILDAQFLAHVGFVDDGEPVVIPMVYARVGDEVVLHGSARSRLLQRLPTAGRVCVATTLVDGLVLARSEFHHSVNYRSVVVFGPARAVEEESEKRRLLSAVVQQTLPGRESRPPNEVELRATAVVAVRIEEASAKQRVGPPVDDEEDLELDVWAGVVPLALQPGAVRADEHVPGGSPTWSPTEHRSWLPAPARGE